MSVMESTFARQALGPHPRVGERSVHRRTAARAGESEAVRHLDLAKVGTAWVVVDGTGAHEPAPRIQRLGRGVRARHLEHDLGLSEPARLVEDRADERLTHPPARARGAAYMPNSVA